MAPDDAADVDLDLLRSSARDFLADRGEKDSVEDLAQLDWTSLLVDEQYGGAGWLPVETVVVAEELGRAGDRSPWFGTTMAAAALASAPAEIRDRWLPSLLDGTVRAGLASAGSTVRVTNADALRLVVTLGSDGIHAFELSDTTSSSRDDELLDVDRPAWRIELAGTEGVRVGETERAHRLLAVGRVLLSADSLGALATTFERLVAYLKERIAFGAPIASFQAVQHRLVDLLVLEAKARAVIMKAARSLVSDEVTGEAIALCAAAHAFVTANAAGAVDECMQLSGGIGFTWEYPLHNELRRVFTNAHLLGTARSSRSAYAAEVGW
ncbi:acyl-CoA dehydrogenase family protein [Mycolicibacterium sp. OfavD-34-C]|uniref:acyl-CoA dehydrogenase family protein n=1 Tax=Mycolicibacterium sp. OfavD-34-C TaxID=2917746 RepID=UPI001EF43C99|nr:acyl-CoA dehydrogenase family protein [Mycolicibacterium sp. OfavD-34-C]MCG7581219.1 acyl-CoA/acyl-ACP dehydrogenase [Mycolicibacterium sp. OfavD-34-C]